jgi:hypothetical protein
LVLPTLVFILWAYGMYALICALCGRRGDKFRAHSPWRRYGWFGLVAGAAAGVGLIAVLAQSFHDQDHNLKLAGFLGTVYAEGWPEGVEHQAEAPPIKNTASGEQPVYAMLHPGMPPMKAAQEETKPRPVPRPKWSKTHPHPKKIKVSAHKSKKEQMTARKKTKTVKKRKPKA